MNIKNKFLLTIAILGMACFTTNAENVTGLSLRVTKQHSLVLSLNNICNNPVQITLKDKVGETLHNEIIKQNDLISRVYNLKNLSFGDYSIVITFSDQIKIQPIEIGINGVALSNSEMQTMFNPVFDQHNEFLDLSMLNLSNNEVQLILKDNDGRAVYSECVTELGSIQRRLNLSNLAKGSYTLTVAVEEIGVFKIFEEIVDWSPKI